MRFIKTINDICEIKGFSGMTEIENILNDSFTLTSYGYENEDLSGDKLIVYRLGNIKVELLTGIIQEKSYFSITIYENFNIVYCNEIVEEPKLFVNKDIMSIILEKALKLFDENNNVDKFTNISFLYLDKLHDVKIEFNKNAECFSGFQLLEINSVKHEIQV